MMTLLFTLIVDRPPLGLSPKSKDLGIFRPPLCNFAAGLTDARHIHVHVYGSGGKRAVPDFGDGNAGNRQRN